MDRIVPVLTHDDVFEEFRGTPIEKLLAYHNFQAPFEKHATAEVLIAMCMDNRKRMNLPDNFAFIIRTGGGNLRLGEFKVSYAIAVGGVSSIALIAHTQCGMVNLVGKREMFVSQLSEKAGWSREKAEEHFMNYAPMFEIGNEIDFALSEARRLRLKYPKIIIAPLLYRVEDNLLYQIREQ